MINIDIEGIDSSVVATMVGSARQQTWDAIKEISKLIKPGIKESEAIKLANQYLASQGVRKFWHKTHIRFGASTTLSFDDPYLPDVTLQENDIMYLDLGPVWGNVEADCGDTFVVGHNPVYEKIVSDLHHIFDNVRDFWRATKSPGTELYRFAKDAIENAGYILHPTYVKGHRLSEFSHFKYGKASLADWPNTPASERWIFELQICDRDRRFGAFYEDLLD